MDGNMKRTSSGRIAMLIAIACSCGTAQATPALMISGLNQGLMHQNLSGAWRVYSAGHEFNYVPNGRCTEVGEQRECLWFGVEFDYAARAQSQVLDCVAEFSALTDVVNPSRAELRQTVEYRFQIPLPGVNGHVSYPGYATGNMAGDEVRVRCSADGAPALDYAFRFPET